MLQSLKTIFLLAITISYVTTFTIESDEDRNLVYVFEIVRHGARAPSTPDPKFEAEGTSYYELTPVGMRQRYLLGRYNLLKYAEMIKDLNVQSTNVYRTLQSGYAELLGMHFNNDKPQLKQVVRDLPFAVRNRTLIENYLKNQSAPDGFINFPIYTWASYSWDDQMNGCKYPHDLAKKLGHLDSTYKGLMYLKDELISANSKNFNKSESFFQNLTFSETHAYDSIITTEKFDMIPQTYDLNETENAAVVAMSKATKLNKFQGDSRRIWVTKQLLAPVNHIVKALNSIYLTGPKYQLYSSHDTNVANILEQIAPDFKWDDIPFAANIYIELYRWGIRYQIRTMYNGSPLPMINCDDEYCDAASWFIGIHKQLFGDDLKEACDRKVSQ